MSSILKVAERSSEYPERIEEYSPRAPGGQGATDAPPRRGG